MEELLKKLQDEHGLSLEQAKGVLNTITSFIKEKFPMVSGAVDNLFPSSAGSETTQSTGGIADKIEAFAKEKLGGLFGGDPA